MELFFFKNIRGHFTNLSATVCEDKIGKFLVKMLDFPCLPFKFNTFLLGTHNAPKLLENSYVPVSIPMYCKNCTFGLQNGKVAERKRDGRNTPVALSVTCALPFLVLLLYIVILFWGTAEGYYIKK